MIDLAAQQFVSGRNAFKGFFQPCIQAFAGACNVFCYAPVQFGRDAQVEGPEVRNAASG